MQFRDHPLQFCGGGGRGVELVQIFTFFQIIIIILLKAIFWKGMDKKKLMLDNFL